MPNLQEQIYHTAWMKMCNWMKTGNVLSIVKLDELNHNNNNKAQCQK